MDLRILRYFLTVAKEQSFTKAAEQLHITQPTLSRQLAAFEEELGISLFNRNGRTITLTDEGILLKRRALEMLDLEKRTLEELKGTEEVIDGSVTIGCGEFAAVEILAEICKVCREKYPLVQIAIHTATADTVYEMMKKVSWTSGCSWNLWIRKVSTTSGSRKVTTGSSGCARTIRSPGKNSSQSRISSGNR